MQPLFGRGLHLLVGVYFLLEDAVELLSRDIAFWNWRMGLHHFASARNLRPHRRCVCSLCFHFVVVFNLQKYEDISDWQNFVLVVLGVKNLLLAAASEIS